MNNAHLFKELTTAPFVFVAMPFFGVENTAEKLITAQEEIEKDIAAVGMKHNLQHLSPNMSIQQDSFEVTYSANSKVPKGTAISHALTLAKRQKKEYDSEGKMPFYFVCCDGSGKIPFSYVGLLAKQLRDGEVNCIFSKRGEEKGISKTRYGIERFEIFVAAPAKSRSSINRIDGQCGLWGFNVTECPDIHLTSTGYEVELEFFVKAHQSRNTRIGTLDIKINPTGQTGFSEDYSKGSNHYQKMYYLMGILGMAKADVLGLVEPFERQTGIKLEPKYMEMIKTMAEPPRQLLEKTIKDVTPPSFL